jgi:hypothetical protein
MLATNEFSSEEGPGVSETSLQEFAQWVSNQLGLTARNGAPKVRIKVEKFEGREPDRITKRVCNKLRANPLIQIECPTTQSGAPRPRVDYIISGRVEAGKP